MTDGEMHIAAALLNLAAVGLPSQSPTPQLDATGKAIISNDTKARNLLIAENHKIFCNFVGQCATDPTDWPAPAQYSGAPAVDPVVGTQIAAALKQILGAAAPALAAANPIAGAVASAVSNIPNPTVSPK